MLKGLEVTGVEWHASGVSEVGHLSRDTEDNTPNICRSLHRHHHQFKTNTCRRSGWAASCYVSFEPTTRWLYLLFTSSLHDLQTQLYVNKALLYSNDKEGGKWVLSLHLSLILLPYLSYTDHKASVYSADKGRKEES
ncbi:hypothetical protein Pmani_011073 [Petrolisthes manimaculis]|uniref:Uncharacterized protein n=1 Tax=Petrolisthes manimaculis TaxID=1843537 RepID=A0AAE1Q032_9EUCA|nr:hypothetical protein Pmani_011073 [Petrolisthes manimaculis]